MGNIEADGRSLEEAVGILKKRLTELISQDQTPIILGGSKETTMAATLAFTERFSKGRMLYLFGHPNLHRPYDHDKLSSQNICSVLDH
jgi:arginase family enzyme